MTRFYLRVLAATSFVAGAASVALSAHAAELPAVYGKAPTAVASPADVASVSPANVAGLLNYCVETNQVSHDDGDSLQAAINAKTNAVPMDHNGNMDYAIGSSGEFLINGNRSTITSLEPAAQGNVCSSVLARAKSLI
ncbi:alcohol dehydrogenase [Acetobacter sicerae]|uniref:Alcohol dehydrogenase n=1 Tax=Acetobacter sicerae TaxID=85325 RepID=A0ABS8VQB4_9PROT|nr:alcohol dehydrogenase [Acetobacter sicerae]MCE0742877.1 alcohol dehydrogenase [Acetobacter sicerae]NHN90795.1 alcohol dehydrogenase [Acetobacter sicerae]